MTDQTTSPESSFGKTPASETTDLLPEFKSGSLEPYPLDENLTPLEIQGAMRVLRFLHRDLQEVNHVLGEVNFERQKGIFSGMKKAYTIAIHSIITRHSEIL